jgi:dynein heavy chain
MSPAKFTLDNMFSIELHKYQELCEETIKTAVNEFAIEKGIDDLASVGLILLFHNFKIILYYPNYMYYYYI